MSRWKRIILVADDFVSLLFPRQCQACGEPLVRNERVICTSCLLDIPTTGYHLKRDNPLEQSFYGRCYIEKAAAWTYYRQGGKAQTLVHQLKYRGVKPIGPFLGSLYGNIIRNTDFSRDLDCIIPVPLHHAKKLKRGFNQSSLIAEGLAEALDLPVCHGQLKRIRSSGTQTNRHRYDRWKNVEGIFSVTRPDELKDKHILLVDDVITTGSTIEACASVLLQISGVKLTVAALATAEKR